MISVVVPVFNEEETIGLLYDRLTAAAGAWGEEHRLVLVDDGSSDRSLEQKMDLSDPPALVVDPLDHAVRVAELEIFNVGRGGS